MYLSLLLEIEHLRSMSKMITCVFFFSIFAQFHIVKIFTIKRYSFQHVVFICSFVQDLDSPKKGCLFICMELLLIDGVRSMYTLSVEACFTIITRSRVCVAIRLLVIIMHVFLVCASGFGFYFLYWNRYKM
jgi:hypothetical protein